MTLLMLRKLKDQQSFCFETKLGPRSTSRNAIGPDRVREVYLQATRAMCEAQAGPRVGAFAARNVMADFLWSRPPTTSSTGALSLGQVRAIIPRLARPFVHLSALV